MKNSWRQALRLVALLALTLLALQLVFVARIALMAVLDPQSTTFQRSEMRRLVVQGRPLAWAQQWVALPQISPHLQRAVIASEDAAFVEHVGVDWDAIERAWDRNQRAEARAERAARVQQRPTRGAAAPARPRHPPKLVGGSTITQQLAKNLLLHGERTVLRKGQELVLTLALEALLSKQRILEIYLNNVEWGEGLFGAQAAARYYFRTDAARLAPEPAARLAVMLPAPKRFEKAPASPYVVERAAVIAARMGAVELPR
ncbi:MAG: transglycosylase domain-containing protein [Betaproteobacteria bacterium]|nr:transglycosylase domain-containing protein [Betaproteobacteria bacterium]MCC6250762.1 transglycosylase domain-containing protein [Rubrivivax sp.]